MKCPWCGADGYDNVILLDGDPNQTPRCGNCLNDVRTETIDRQWNAALETISRLMMDEWREATERLATTLSQLRRS